MRCRGSTGFLLVSVLLISIIVLTLGMTFLGKRAVQYRRAALFEAAAQARAYAESGLEDALIKFRWDLEFPPLSKDQHAFTYTKDFVSGTDRIGGYKVILDGDRRFPPYKIWIVTATGDVGGDPLKPTALRTLQLEFDVSKHPRGDISYHAPSASATNPFYYKVINFRDLGGL
jgi:hypothetical protein